MKWINVEDELPEIKKDVEVTSESVLVYRDCGKGTLGSVSVSFLWDKPTAMNKYGVSELWNGQESAGYRVTHWMPLPKPPEASR